MELDGKTAVITGGGRGIGASIARKLAAMGANTVLCGRTEAPLRATATDSQKSGGKCEAAACDVTNLAALEQLAKRVGQSGGGCEILVNNAGVGGFSAALHELPPAEWEKI